jgi:membrane protease YdiL (CAAX protease family)
MPMTILPFVLLAAFILFLGPWDIWELRRLRAARPGAKASFYIRTSVVLWLLTGLCLLVYPINAIWDAPAFGALLLSVVTWHVLAYAVVALFIGSSWLQMVQLYYAGPEKRARALKPLYAMDFFLPGSLRERALFAVVCLSAGIGEEVMFRGFLLHYLIDSNLGMTLAVLGTSIVFGLGHAGHGWSGIIRTSLLGLLMGLLYLGTGSLLAVIILHASIDLNALAASALLVKPEATPGASPAVQ